MDFIELLRRLFRWRKRDKGSSVNGAARGSAPEHPEADREPHKRDATEETTDQDRPPIRPEMPEVARERWCHHFVHNDPSLSHWAKDLLSGNMDLVNETIRRVFSMAQAGNPDAVRVLEEAIAFKCLLYGNVTCTFYDPGIRVGNALKMVEDRTNAPSRILAIACEHRLWTCQPHEIQELLTLCASRDMSTWEELLKAVERQAGREQAHALMLLSTHLQARELLGVRAQEQSPSLICDVCGKAVPHRGGHCLSTAEVVAEPRYWEFRFVSNPDQVALIGQDGAHLVAFAIEVASSITVWLVCEQCVGMFNVDREKTKAVCLRLSPAPSTFLGKTRLGPGDFEAADTAAQEGWTMAFGTQPTLLKGDPAIPNAMARYAVAKATYERSEKT